MAKPIDVRCFRSYLRVCKRCSNLFYTPYKIGRICLKCKRRSGLSVRRLRKHGKV